MFSFLKTKYDYIISPLDKSIFDITPAEAAAYFSWYLEKLPERVEYISRICARELHIRRERMDCSPESLILLWKWFRRRAKKQPGPTPQNPKQKVLTPETELLLQDVGMYLGETLRKNVPGIRWTFYTEPKNDFFCNQPLLTGFVDMTSGKPFQAVFQPIHMAGIQARKLLRWESDDHDLYNLYCLWSKKALK